MGVKASEKAKEVAFVKCKGTCDKVKVQYNYYGVKDCQQAAVVPGKGEKQCQYGCMGYGSCVKACEFDAIHVIDGVAIVDKEKCVACRKCIPVCPNELIELVPYEAKHLVQCNSKDKGKDVKAICEVGCIACTLCVKVCEFDAIHVVDNIAHIDYDKCTNCGACAEKCPVKVIV
jgi:ferredoxin